MNNEDVYIDYVVVVTSWIRQLKPPRENDTSVLKRAVGSQIYLRRQMK
jgi:hypothetical protein